MFDLVVVGAGIAGMRVALSVKEKRPKWSIAVVERAPRCGGRILTSLDDEERVEYETGPWRIHESHTLTRESIDSMGLSFAPYRAKKRLLGAADSGGNKDSGCGDDASLSDWDVRALREGPAAADQSGYRTGYGPEFQRGACGTNVYRTPREGSGGDDEGGFDAVAKGLSEWVHRLSVKLEQSGVKLFLSHKVVDIEPTTCGRRCGHRRYRLHLRHRQKETRDGGSGIRVNVAERRLRARIVCLALPPRFTEEWPSIRGPLALLRSQVGSLPLMHVYARFASGDDARRVCLDSSGCTEGGGFHLVHPGIGCQLISPPGEADKGSCWVLVAYTGAPRPRRSRGRA